jgi:hypothetical protein
MTLVSERNRSWISATRPFQASAVVARREILTWYGQLVRCVGPLCVLVASGCASRQLGPNWPPAVDAGPQAAVAEASGTPAADEMEGEWTGWYTCGQQKIGLRVSIQPVALEPIGKRSPPQFRLKVAGRLHSLPPPESGDAPAVNVPIEGLFGLDVAEVHTLSDQTSPRRLELSGHVSKDGSTFSGKFSDVRCDSFLLRKTAKQE